MTFSTARTGFLAATLMALATPAHAGRPLTTEDAAILDDKAGQLEAWVDRARDVTVSWFVPACNFGLGIEWQVGVARDWSDGAERWPESYAQAKGLFRKSTDDSPWAAGWVLGVAHRTTNSPYVLLPVSWSVGDFNFHVQPGWVRDRENKRDLAVWGVAVEHTSKPLDIVAELFGQNSEKPFARAGLRWTPIIDYLDIDITYVWRLGGTRDDRLVSVGFVWYGPPFLP